MPAPTWNDPPIDPRHAKQKRRTRIVLIWFWSAVAAVVVLAVIGSFIPEEEQTAPAATEQRPTTTATTAPTSTLSALQEMFADWTEQDCADEAVWYRAFYTPEESDKRAAMREDIEAGRFMEAEWDYWDLWAMTTIALDDYAQWMEICASKSSPALVAEVESFPLIVKEARDALREECHAIQARLAAEDRYVDFSGDLLVWTQCTH